MLPSAPLEISPLWIAIIGGLGGLVVAAFNVLYQEIRRVAIKRAAVQESAEHHLDPMLKCVDEVVGKVRYLAEKDFHHLRTAKGPLEKTPRTSEMASMLYLVSSFWAQIEILRETGQFFELGNDRRVQKMTRFLRCLESKKTRIVDRSTQKAIGECCINRQYEKPTLIPYIEFYSRLANDREFAIWLQPLFNFLSRLRHTRERQGLLHYGAILQSMVDTLDPKRRISKDRPSWPNKLTLKTKRGLYYRVFRLYLPFVKKPEKYTGEIRRPVKLWQIRRLAAHLLGRH